MKKEIKKILEQTFAYNVENDKVAQELLDLFSVSKNKPLPPPPPKDREIHISGKSRHKR